MRKLFLDTGIYSNLDGADDLVMGLETDIKMITDNEDDDDEAFHVSVAKDIAAATANISISLRE